MQVTDGNSSCNGNDITIYYTGNRRIPPCVLAPQYPLVRRCVTVKVQPMIVEPNNAKHRNNDNKEWAAVYCTWHRVSSARRAHSQRHEQYNSGEVKVLGSTILSHLNCASNAHFDFFFELTSASTDVARCLHSVIFATHVVLPNARRAAVIRSEVYGWRPTRNRVSGGHGERGVRSLLCINPRVHNGTKDASCFVTLRSEISSPRRSP